MTYSSLESFGEAGNELIIFPFSLFQSILIYILSEYYMTCIVAAVEFIDSLKIPDEIQLQLSENMLQTDEFHENSITQRETLEIDNTLSGSIVSYSSIV